MWTAACEMNPLKRLKKNYPNKGQQDGSVGKDTWCKPDGMN